MDDANKYTDTAALIESMKQRIEKMLMEEVSTFGVAKSIIQAVEADLLGDGNTFLNKSALKNVLPFRD